MEQTPISSERLEEFFSKAGSLIETHRYFLERMADELRSVKESKSVNPECLLKASAYIYAHGGYHDLAINELNALISISTDNIHHQNKLAQIYIRRGRDGDFTKALEISSRLLDATTELTQGDAWFANHNAALVSLALGKATDAVSYGEAALGHRDDPRTRAIIDQARAPSGSEIKFFSFASGEAPSFGQSVVVAGMSRMEMF